MNATAHTGTLKIHFTEHNVTWLCLWYILSLYVLAGPRSAVNRAPDLYIWIWFPVWTHTFVSPSADSSGAVVSYWRPYVPKVLVNHEGGLSLPRKRVVRLNDCPDMTIDVYRVCKTTTQQQKQKPVPKWVNSSYKQAKNSFYWIQCKHYTWSMFCVYLVYICIKSPLFRCNIYSFNG